MKIFVKTMMGTVMEVDISEKMTVSALLEEILNPKVTHEGSVLGCLLYNGRKHLPSNICLKDIALKDGQTIFHVFRTGCHSAPLPDVDIYNAKYLDQANCSSEPLASGASQQISPVSVEEMVERLTERLTAYIERVEKNSFQHEFIFFPKTQGANRKANYNLAIKLRQQLQEGGKLADVFSDENILSYRIVDVLNKPYWNLGVQSRELKDIIQDGKDLAEGHGASNRCCY